MMACDPAPKLPNFTTGDLGPGSRQASKLCCTAMNESEGKLKTFVATSVFYSHTKNVRIATR